MFHLKLLLKMTFWFPGGRSLWSKPPEGAPFTIFQDQEEDKENFQYVFGSPEFIKMNNSKNKDSNGAFFSVLVLQKCLLTGKLADVWLKSLHRRPTSPTYGGTLLVSAPQTQRNSLSVSRTPPST